MRDPCSRTTERTLRGFSIHETQPLFKSIWLVPSRRVSVSLFDLPVSDISTRDVDEYDVSSVDQSLGPLSSVERPGETGPDTRISVRKWKGSQSDTKFTYTGRDSPVVPQSLDPKRPPV